MDSGICHGKPCIRGLRYPVENILEWLGSGMSVEDILADYDDLEREEYISAEFEEYMKKEGITHQLTVPYSPQQNGVAERFNGTLMEMARSMLHGANLPKGFWGEAVMAANYLKNRSPHKALKEEATPLEAYSGYKPYVGHLRVFGCTASVLVPEQRRTKLDIRFWRGVFVGYALLDR